MDERQDDTTYGSTPEPGADTPGDSGNGSPGASGRSGRGPSPDQMVGQLQAMIDGLARQAGPVVREVAAKAAELASIAAERAGPIAHRAADVTEEVGGKVAARTKEVAADLRRSAGTHHADSDLGEPIVIDETEVAAPAAEPGDEAAGSSDLG
jgi:hypothetical protein